MNVYVYRTSLRPADIPAVDALLTALLPNARWSYDLDDCDRILRVETSADGEARVRRRLREHGFVCEELEG